jgi:hypothetical protein
MAKRFSIDPAAAAATFLGTLQGASGALSIVVCDGARAAAWPGWDGSEDGRNRTLVAAWEDIEAGAACYAGSAGSASVWQLDNGIAFFEFFPDENLDEDAKDVRSASRCAR